MQGKLLVVLPAPRHPLVDGRVMMWLTALCRRYHNIEPINPCGDSCDANRNAAIAAALAREPDVRHFFFLDSDTVPPPDAVERLLALQVPVACGVTPIRRVRATFWNVRAGGEDSWWPRDVPLPDRPFRVRHVGGTTVLVERRVIEAIGYPWFKREYHEHGPVGGEFVKRSGDVFFSDRCRECGFDIVCDPAVRCHHYKVTDLLEDDEPNGSRRVFKEASSVGPAAGARPSSPDRSVAGGDVQVDFAELCRQATLEK